MYSFPGETSTGTMCPGNLVANATSPATPVARYSVMKIDPPPATRLITPNKPPPPANCVCVVISMELPIHESSPASEMTDSLGSRTNPKTGIVVPVMRDCMTLSLINNCENSIRSRCPSLNRCHGDMPALGDDLEQYPPVPDAAAKTGQSLQLADYSLKRVLLHFRQGRQNARPVARRNALKRLSCRPGRGDGPFQRGTPLDSRSPPVCTHSSRSGKLAPPPPWASPSESTAPTDTPATPRAPTPTACDVLLSCSSPPASPSP